MQEGLCLVGDGSDDLGMRMTDVAHAEGCGEIDEAIPVDVPEVRVGSAFPKNRRWIERRDVSALDFRETRGEGARFGSRNFAEQGGTERGWEIFHGSVEGIRVGRGGLHRNIIGREGQVRREPLIWVALALNAIRDQESVTPTMLGPAGDRERRMRSGGEIVYVALGANLGDRGATFATVIATIEKDADLDLLRVSSIFETDPMGPLGQGTYLNAVIELRVRLDPFELLTLLHAIERAMGRDRGAETERWGARELDLDILFFGDRRIDSVDLVVPHARAHERNFVMTPLAEIVPDLIHPVFGISIAEIALGLPKLDRHRVWAESAAWPRLAQV